MIFPDALQHIDEHLFFLINRDWASHFFDTLFIPVRDKYFWVPLYVVIAVVLIWKFKMKSIFLMLLLGLNLTASDQVSSAVVKPLVQRDRPCNNETIKNEVIVRIDRCGVGKSFTSSHAANTFAFALMLTLLFGKKNKWVAPLAFFWAAFISYAQVYVGVHYPLDVIGGAILGVLLTLIIYFTAKKLLFKRIGWEY